MQSHQLWPHWPTQGSMAVSPKRKKQGLGVQWRKLNRALAEHLWYYPGSGENEVNWSGTFKIMHIEVAHAMLQVGHPCLKTTHTQTNAVILLQLRRTRLEQNCCFPLWVLQFQPDSYCMVFNKGNTQFCPVPATYPIAAALLYALASPALEVADTGQVPHLACEQVNFQNTGEKKKRSWIQQQRWTYLKRDVKTDQQSMFQIPGKSFSARLLQWLFKHSLEFLFCLKQHCTTWRLAILIIPCCRLFWLPYTHNFS